jgi:hypothetical protein
MQNAPTPDLRILHVQNISPHEEHDSQRSAPLVERIRQAQMFTNPPIVAPMDDENYVLLDGANRYHCFCELGYEHILVQVAPYESGFVELGVWQHIIAKWSQEALIEAIKGLPNIRLRMGWNTKAVAQVLTREGTVIAIDAPAETVEQRNATLCEVVRIYQRNAALHRTVMTDTIKLWQLYPEAIALVLFPDYRPEDIIAAARYQAFLPPGISRHIIQGRALRLMYPLATLYDKTVNLEAKNEALQEWMRQRLANRSVRYYAESTYQFDE